MGSSKTLVSRFLPANSPANRASVLSRGVSTSPPAFGEVDLRVGAKASFNRPTGDAPRCFDWRSMVFVCCKGGPSECTESARLTFAESTESIVSDVIRGEDNVSSPACE